ncbi:helix-turn-helix domain-containing protein [Maribacter aestuarii]|uniref:helix-turn-helix domain-containing protein n=1 Tax=Maribacter aestuarii TaxID=1130723 RepID=UPI00248B71CF|nr:helix-turn-helix domain-containing protein [Maribacter aestuarii]
MREQSFQMINLSMDDLSKLITSCISEQFKVIREYNHSKPSEKEKEILSVDEVTDLLGLSKTTLWKYRKNGTLPAKKVGSRVYYSRAELFNFLNNAG